MSMDRDELCGSLLTWLQTFQVPCPCATYQDLTGGVAIAHVLHKIDPAWFNEAWLQRIKEEAGDNWRLKLSNLKKVLQSILEYYQDVLGHPVSDNHLPDVNLIGEFSDTGELGKLLQLVLGCAISCEKKQEHIQQIMTLEESVQHMVMTAIQELMTKDSSETLTADTYGNFDYQSRKYYFLSDELEEKEDVMQRCHDLEQQISVILEEKQNLATENKSLKERQSHLDSFENTGITGKKLLLLQSQIEQLQEENFRLESAKDDYRIRCDELDREVLDLQRRNEDLTSLAEEAQSLKDEMDVLRHSSDKVNKLEAMVDSYKKKMEDLGDLRRQVKLLEERNTVYMQRTCELEEELRKANSVRIQLEAHKKQVQELHSQRSDEAMKAEKWQFEFQNLREKFDALQKEKERMILERDALREANDELRCAQVQQTCLSQADAVHEVTTSPVENLASEFVPAELAELRETIVRMQHENKMLCTQEATYRDRLSELQGLLEESSRSKNRLETETRLNQQQLVELRVQVEELQKALQEQGSKAEDSSLLKRKLEEHLEKLHEAHSELQKKKEFIDDLEPKENTSKKIDELQQILKKKDEDMRAMEERYKRYVEKARTVIKTLDPKQNTTIAPEIQALKNQLHEKDTRIQYMENDFEKSKSQRELEEKLIISAWYNMGMALHQRATEQRAPFPGPAQSFLAQQRLATNSRRGRLNRTQSMVINYTPSEKPMPPH
ncbi:protein Hook homolog 2 isoform X2 [Ambystoma mexicanum]|uniref:protein Hook homolog 2 isoform X2 n=1 Tax=Ambystoma mexicanum TaxID=8296 RepID=UPI0037E8CC83